MRKKTVALIGSGKMGRAFAKLLHEKAECLLWDTDVSRMPKKISLEEAVGSADVLILCVGSWHLSDAIAEIKPYLQKHTVVISISKGVVTPGILVDELINKQLSGQPWGFLGGPMLANEILGGQIAHGVFSSSLETVQKEITELFSNTTLKIETEQDLRGVVLGGVLKNIYAIGFGMVTAMEWSMNQRGWFVARAFNEMLGLAKKLGGSEQTLMKTAGLGDFVTTAFGGTSCNFLAGFELGKLGKTSVQSEAMISLPFFLNRLGKFKHPPLLSAIRNVVIDHNSFQL